MPTTTTNPTTNTTPDPAQGGTAVTGSINTGHASTVATGAGAGSQTKTDIWTGFPAAPAGAITSINLLVGFTRTGGLSDGGAGTSNQFRLQYSVNSGGAWTTIRDDTQVQGPVSGTDTVALSTSQNLTQVQVRSLIKASGVIGEVASCTATVSDIRLQITQPGANAPVIMM